MTRRVVLALRLLLVAGLFAAPAPNFVPGQRVAGGDEPASAANISISALVPAVTPARPQSIGRWVGGWRDQQRIFTTRVWALTASAAAAVLLAFGLLRATRGWRARLLVAGRAPSPRAPPASAFA